MVFYSKLDFKIDINEEGFEEADTIYCRYPNNTIHIFIFKPNLIIEEHKELDPTIYGGHIIDFTFCLLNRVESNGSIILESVETNIDKNNEIIVPDFCNLQLQQTFINCGIIQPTGKKILNRERMFSVFRLLVKPKNFQDI